MHRVGSLRRCGGEQVVTMKTDDGALVAWRRSPSEVKAKQGGGVSREGARGTRASRKQQPWATRAGGAHAGTPTEAIHWASAAEIAASRAQHKHERTQPK